jgi:hypothetical protein
MADKTTYLRAFNTHFFDFIDDIISVIPDNQEIVYGKKSLETIKRANPTLIIKVWYSMVFLPYKDVIEAGNIEFFFDKDYKNEVSQLANADEIVKIVDKLREPVRQMDGVNKEHSMKFIQNLSQLSMLYSSA